MSGEIGLLVIGLGMMLIGGCMVETPLVSPDMGIAAIIGGFVFGALFFVPGLFMFRSAIQDIKKARKKIDPEKVKESLKPGFKEAKKNSPLRSKLVQFREHYSDFFEVEQTAENASIQQDVTQIFRSMMDLQKNRLNRLGMTLEMTVKSMIYDREDGMSQHMFSDGKYDITEVQEEISAKTVYKMRGRSIYTKTDRNLANYTLIHAKTIGKDKIICPNCGVETTREALLDGCDYCKTKFRVEDLGTRVAAFAFRPDYKLQYAKYEKVRNKTLEILSALLVLGVVIFFICLAFKYGPGIMREEGVGIVLIITAMIFAVVVSSAVFIVAFMIVYGAIIFPLVLLFAGLNVASKEAVKRLKDQPQFDRTLVKHIHETDPNFSSANFYSGLQNKLSSVIFAENEVQIEAFALGDLSGMLGKYANVVGVETDYMGIYDYRVDKKHQHIDVLVYLSLTELKGSRCRIRKERWSVSLVKAADCMTQVVCAPAMMVCESCGTSLDLLKGKTCQYCGHVVPMERFDWVIEEIRKENK